MAHLWNDSASLLPTYASDTSGVASALYELGGMTVIHDASGCNSTYSTFDEPRWYDQESLVVISALTEMDAVLGNEEKLVNDCVEQARLLSPAFVALANSPLAMLMGCDMEALAREIEARLAIPCFALHTNGIASYLSGVSQAFVAVSKRFTKDFPKSSEKSLNLLGATPLDIGEPELTAILAWAESFGFRLNACVAQKTSLAAIAHLAEAHVNLVLSSSALALADYLQERFGTPYVVGRPFGFFAEELASFLLQAAETGQSRPLQHTKTTQGQRVALVGESVAIASMAQALVHFGFGQSRLFCPLEGWEEVLGEEDVGGEENEDAVQDFLAAADLIVADPLYKLVSPPKTPFLALPHTAFSGRTYLAANQSLLGQGLYDELCKEHLC